MANPKLEDALSEVVKEIQITERGMHDIHQDIQRLEEELLVRRKQLADGEVAICQLKEAAESIRSVL